MTYTESSIKSPSVLVQTVLAISEVSRLLGLALVPSCCCCRDNGKTSYQLFISTWLVLPSLDQVFSQTIFVASFPQRQAHYKMSSPLMALPIELRLSIYEYVFCTDDLPRIVDLMKAKDIYPSSALLIVCRRVNKEVLPEHERAVERFWADRQFALHLTRQHASQIHRCETVRKIRSMRLLEIRRIETLSFVWNDVTASLPCPALWISISGDDEYNVSHSSELDAEDSFVRDVSKLMWDNEWLNDMVDGGKGVNVALCVAKCFHAIMFHSREGLAWPHIWEPVDEE